MRLTAEQFQERQENRVTGAYTVKPPNSERRGRKKVVPHCENCGRETEYLFDGIVISKATRFDLNTKKPIGVVDVHREGQVCQRCRPPSNLEIEEILNGTNG